MEIWTAFLLGLGGSLHCIGMCGPLALALPGGKGPHYLLGRLAYNGGRVLTYACLGGIFGFLGERIELAGLQQGLSIALGLLLIAATLAPGSWRQALLSTALIAAPLRALKNTLAHLFSRKSLALFLPIGLLNGLLPCGMVYLALAAATATGTPTGGMAYMAAFGAGTLPLMLLTSLAGGLAGPSLRRLSHRLVPAAAITLGALFVLRGLALDIPLLSPPNPSDLSAMQHHHHH